MIEKLKKHLLLLNRKITQNREINRMKKCPDHTVQIILEALQAVRSNTCNQVDREAFERCESYRKNLLNSDEKISFGVFGLNKVQTIGEICRKASSPKIWCQFLYMLTKNSSSKNILEIGTNLGVSGSYLLEAIAGNPQAKLTTMEGVPQLCKISSRRFSEIVNTDKFEIVEGLYKDTFPKIIQKTIPFDLIFIDGNHQEDATLDYFYKLKSGIKQKAVFIFDDINWSNGMKSAWKTIKKDENVAFSIDLWKQGLAVVDSTIVVKHTEYKLFLAY
jgi:predicted O-methyltransferase YrrM